ncbi:hypothetical protein [Lamprobacter modestohalophilus]|uniref:hypothetical protein n=1 Tax=Lamprobacter modestohalophilus TaxID=1064514 RepID=UPI003B84AE6F
MGNRSRRCSAESPRGGSHGSGTTHGLDELSAGGTGLGSIAAISIGARRLFDGRHRLRLVRLRAV